MAGLRYLYQGQIKSLEGPEYLGLSGGVRKLNVRTGTGANDVLKYGLTSDSSASQYCPIAVNVNGTKCYIARSQSRVRVVGDPYEPWGGSGYRSASAEVMVGTYGYNQTTTVNQVCQTMISSESFYGATKTSTSLLVGSYSSAYSYSYIQITASLNSTVANSFVTQTSSWRKTGMDYVHYIRNSSQIDGTKYTATNLDVTLTNYTTYMWYSPKISYTYDKVSSTYQKGPGYTITQSERYYTNQTTVSNRPVYSTSRSSRSYSTWNTQIRHYNTTEVVTNYGMTNSKGTKTTITNVPVFVRSTTRIASVANQYPAVWGAAERHATYVTEKGTKTVWTTYANYRTYISETMNNINM